MKSINQPFVRQYSIAISRTQSMIFNAIKKFCLTGIFLYTVYVLLTLSAVTLNDHTNTNISPDLFDVDFKNE